MSQTSNRNHRPTPSSTSKRSSGVSKADLVMIADSTGALDAAEAARLCARYRGTSQGRLSQTCRS